MKLKIHRLLDDHPKMGSHHTPTMEHMLTMTGQWMDIRAVKVCSFIFRMLTAEGNGMWYMLFVLKVCCITFLKF
jgi:hypothetical protein